MRPRTVFVLASFALPALAGCEEAFGTKDRDTPGDDLGRYEVTAEPEVATCGAGQLEAADPWVFQVRLSRDYGTVYWNQGAQIIGGALGADGRTFELAATVEVDLRDDDNPETPVVKPACVVTRRDTARATLDADGAEATSFTGRIGFRFDPTADSDCSDLLTADPPLAERLPCETAYAMKGERLGVETD